MRLADYLKRRQITPQKFADDLEVSAEAVRLWIRGKRVPRPDVMKEITKATGGEVRPNDFFEPEHAA